jgi:MoaA/NifB/PqqE/SkfB family radical SAM enzyme
MERRFVDISTFKQTIDVFRDLGFYNISLTGGEPLVHPKYFSFIRHIKKKGLYANSPTNGTLLTEKNVKRLKDSGIDSVGVSIDSLDPLVSDSVRNHPGQLRKALNGLTLLKKYKIPRSAIIIIAKHNIHEFCDMVKILDKKYDTPSVLCFPDSGIGPLKEIIFTDDEFIEAVDSLLELKEDGYRLQNTKEYLLELKRDYLGKERKNPCYGGYYMINAYWDGTVKPCFNKEPIGNVTSLKDLRKEPCSMCLNQCFMEFSYISECIAQKHFLKALREWWEMLKIHF